MTSRRRRFDALFLDRDGTLIVERGFLKDPGGVRLARGAVERLRGFAGEGTLFFVVTNQSGLARGLLTPEDVRAVNEEVARRLRRRGVAVAGFLVCPHHPDGRVPGLARRCRCRKPGTLLYRRALKANGLLARRCAVIGDKWEDIGAAVALGAMAVHVLTGFGRRHRPVVRARAPDAILACSLADALTKLRSAVPRAPGRGAREDRG